MADVVDEEDERDEREIELSAETSKESFPGEAGSAFFELNLAPTLRSETEVSKSLEEGVVTDRHLSNIAHELGLIKLCWEDVPSFSFDDRVHFPPSYLSNNKKEKLLLWYAENFRQQFSFKYPNRRPLLIACDNECKVQKMVCTTIRPTNMKFPELQSWQGCAKFVSEHLTYEELENPTVLPDHNNSPQTVLKRQSGHSFEYATLLASFLLGSGYDAYVVSGYATREICQKDQTRVECPFLQDEPVEEEEEEIEEDTKYFLKKPPELVSRFLMEMEARELQKQKDAQIAQELAELEAIKEFEKPSPDELWTWRLHSWVLILPSKEITEPLFVESTTGVGKSIDDPDYHGIESIWNHQNYWVFVQFPFKTETCKDINFEINNPLYWERLLIGEPITFREMPQEYLEADTDEFERLCVQAEKHLDMPTSWVEILKLSHSDYERRYPTGKKILHYRKAISEQYPPYSHADGLMERVTRFDDYECQDPREVRESYKYRQDRMYFCEKSISDNLVHEKFERGREDALKEHFYYSMDSGIEVRFTLLFYDQARLDGLSKLVMDPLYMTLYYENRDDFLYYTHVDFAERLNQDQPFRAIVKITEKYHRNPKKIASKDVAMVEYYYMEKKIELKFHYEPEHITQGHRIFLKPPFSERGFIFDPSLTSGYLTSPDAPVPKPLYLYRLEVEYFKQQDIVEKKIRDRENELLCLLRLRGQEHAAPKLIVTEFDIERNEEAKQAYKERELQRLEALEREMSMICDFLLPYYAKLKIKPKTILPQKLAQQVVEECLNDWKNLLVARANNIQQQFEQTCHEFHEKNSWFEKNQNSVTKEQEEEYFDYCKKNSFYLQILELRLNRHKEMAPKRYLTILEYLKADPRVNIAFRPVKRKSKV